MKIFKKITVYLFLLLLLLPLLGLPFAGPGSAGSEEEAPFPSLISEGKLNLSFLSEAGACFEKHFAFRSCLVSANSFLRETCFKSSSDEGVVVGKEGWLFYADSVRDYTGSDPLSDRALYGLARNLWQIQRFVESQGGRFLYLPVPNKNSCCPGKMPEQFLPAPLSGHDLLRLNPFLDQLGVSYVDLLPLLSGDESLWHRRDSHWNGKGAFLAACAAQKALGLPAGSFEPFAEREDFTGDLERMLYPFHPAKETEIYGTAASEWSYEGEPESNFDPEIETRSGAEGGSLVLYRDSFANALIPFEAALYREAFFTRAAPYDLTEFLRRGADTVIIERAERFLPQQTLEPPLLPALRIRPIEEETSLPFTVTSQGQIGAFYRICGYVEKKAAEGLPTDAPLFVKTGPGQVYEALLCRLQDGEEISDYGFCVNLPIQEFPKGCAELSLSTLSAAG